jgi:hypothetical protein
MKSINVLNRHLPIFVCWVFDSKKLGLLVIEDCVSKIMTAIIPVKLRYTSCEYQFFINENSSEGLEENKLFAII